MGKGRIAIRNSFLLGEHHPVRRNPPRTVRACGQAEFMAWKRYVRLVKKKKRGDNPGEGYGDSGDRPLGHTGSYLAAALSASHLHGASIGLNCVCLLSKRILMMRHSALHTLLAHQVIS